MRLLLNYFNTYLLRKKSFHLIVSSKRCISNDSNHYQIYRFNNILKLFSNDDLTIISKQTLKDANIVHRFLIKSPHSGLFILMPLIVRVMEKLINLIDREMSLIGAQKIVMPSLVNASLWQKSGRWNDAGTEVFKLKDRHDLDFCLGPTHEEVVTQLIHSILRNHNLLPVYVYQITPKFRDELRVKLGLLRSKEFIMKDLYTFDCGVNEANQTYNSVCLSYERLFKKLNLPVVKAVGSVGSIGGKHSHEYHLISDIGEDRLLICESCGSAFNREVLEEPNRCRNCNGNLRSENGIEIGHAFFLGTRYSKSFELTFALNDGDVQSQKFIEMGCYGLGVTRMIAASLEILSDGKTLRWPFSIAPFNICMVLPKKGSKEEIGGGTVFAEDVSVIMRDFLCEDILVDDRTHLTIGKRWKDISVLGIPYIVIAGKRIIDNVPIFEVIDTYTNEINFFTQSQTLYFLKDKLKLIKY